MSEKKQSLSHIRNMGIIAHIDAGKTTVSERILFYTGKEHRMGEVHDGTAVMDYLIDEQQRGITITAAATMITWNDYIINLIDTPGHVDFTAEVERSLRVLDGAVTVFCGVAGVEAQSETVWRQANRYHVPRLCFINKLDRTGADFEYALETIRKRLGAKAVVMQIPVGREDQFQGVIDLVKQVFYTFPDEDLGAKVVENPIPEEMRDIVEIQRHELIETAAEANEELMEKYLTDDTLSDEDIRRGIRELTIRLEIFPVFCGTALKHKGIQPLLDAIIDYLPSPKDVPPIEGHLPDSDEVIIRHATSKEPFCGLVFKIQSDTHGDLMFVRTYSGVLKEGDRVMLYGREKPRKERVNRLWRMHANDRKQEKIVGPGDIIAVVGLKFARTGDTICAEEAPIELARLQFQETVISMAIEPNSNDDRDKLMDVLTTLEREDPTFRHFTDKETGQLIISGMGELHLDIIRTRITRDFNVAAKVGDPRVTYRESATLTQKDQGIFSQLVAGKPQYGEVSVTVEPAPELASYEIIDELPDGIIPEQMQEACIAGIESSLTSGPLGGYPIVQTRIRLTGAGFHDGEASEMAYAAAADMAVRNAMQNADPALLEPIMSVEVHVPEEFLGNIIHDLNGRRAEVGNIESRGHLMVAQAKAPLSEMFGYATVVRSLSQGRATYSMEPNAFAAVGKQRRDQILGY